MVDNNLHFNSKGIMVEAVLFGLVHGIMRFSVVSLTNIDDIVGGADPEVVTYIHNPKLKNQQPVLNGSNYHADLQIGGRPTRVNVEYSDIVEIRVLDGGSLVTFSIDLNNDLDETNVEEKEPRRKNHLRSVN